MRSNITWTRPELVAVFSFKVFYRSLDPPFGCPISGPKTICFWWVYIGAKNFRPKRRKKGNRSRSFFGIQLLWLSFQIPEIEWLHDGPNGQVMTSRLRQDGFALAPYWEASSLHGDTFDLRLEESDLGEPHHMWKHHEVSLLVLIVEILLYSMDP